MGVIAADVGGSKTLLGWFPDATSAVSTRYFDNHDFPDLESILQQYLDEHPQISPDTSLCSIAIAGPVRDHRLCRMTNLPWTISADQLQRRFGFTRVTLLNDLEATAFAMPGQSMSPHLLSLNGKDVNFTRNVAVISVGTGLGEALLQPDPDRGMRVLPSEGGHKSFAPFDSPSAALLYTAYSAGKSCLSWEDWFSGAGMPQLFAALFPQDLPLSSADITRQAVATPTSHAAQCIEFFTQGLYAEAGNLALQGWCDGGIVLAGGVAQYIQPWLQRPELQAMVSRKSRHAAWLAQLPLALCTNVHAALQGAADFGWQSP